LGGFRKGKKRYATQREEGGSSGGEFLSGFGIMGSLLSVEGGRGKIWQSW
jgi:hypothetical protein